MDNAGLWDCKGYSFKETNTFIQQECIQLFKSYNKDFIMLSQKYKTVVLNIDE